MSTPPERMMVDKPEEVKNEEEKKEEVSELLDNSSGPWRSKRNKAHQPASAGFMQ